MKKFHVKIWAGPTEHTMRFVSARSHEEAEREVAEMLYIPIAAIDSSVVVEERATPEQLVEDFERMNLNRPLNSSGKAAGQLT